MIKEIKVIVSTDRIGSQVEHIMEIYQDDWEDMSDIERSDVVQEFAENNMMFQIDWEE